MNTLISVLESQSALQPNAPIYTFLGDDGAIERRLTYQELHDEANALAAHLIATGQSGKPVLLLYPPSIDYIIGFFGCLYAGAYAIPAYPPLNPRQQNRLIHLLNDCETHCILTTETLLPIIEFTYKNVIAAKSIVCLATDTLDFSVASSIRPKIEQDNIAFIQYTSGSTGNPRGVVLTHANLLHNLSLIASCFGANKQSIGVIWLPPYHDMGLIGGLLEPLYQGTQCYLMSPLTFIRKPILWLKAISKYGATHSGGPNFAYDLCVRKFKPELEDSLELSSWKVAFNGAEPIRPATLQRFADTFSAYGFREEAFLPCYGLAESTLIVAGTQHDKKPTKLVIESAALAHNKVSISSNDGQGELTTLVSSGHILKGLTAHIVNPETLELCYADQIGEIWVAGDSVAQGYWTMPPNGNVFGAVLPSEPSKQFLRTGDLGFFRDGHLYITGRLKDLIILHGANYYPQDIESIIENIDPSVRPGCIVAFSVTSEAKERLVILVEIRRGFQLDSINQNNVHSVNVVQLRSKIRSQISQSLRLMAHDIVFLPGGSLPKTSSGKIQRSLSKSKYLNGTLESPLA